MAPATPVTAVPVILSRARQFNQANNITGMLVFDGLRFAELLEGPPDAVLELTERIREDSRHTNMEVVHHASVAERRFTRFSMGYVPIEEDDALAQLEQCEGPAAMQRFLDLIPVLDLGY
ncbi:MAG: BLUF domain-containing protein [Bdellovibrionales bacterium]|nr:BLUF domain-containing protein [Ramlibacter sp.]